MIFTSLRIGLRNPILRQSLGVRSPIQQRFVLNNRYYASKRNGSTSEISKLLRLVKPEYKILAAALACLVTTSTVTMTLPLFIGKIIDTVGEKNDLSIIGLEKYQFYGLLSGVFLVGAVSNFGRIYLLRSVGEKLVARLRSRLFLKILAQDSYFFDVGPTSNGMRTGDLISRITSDTQIISKTLSGNLSDGARALISGVVGIAMMSYVSWKMTLSMSIIFPPLVIMSRFYGSKIKTLSRQIQSNLGDMTKLLEEKLNGIKTIQSFAQQRAVIHDYNKEIKVLYNNSMREGMLSGIFYGGNGFIGNMSIVGILILGTNLISTGELSIGDLSSFMMYALYTGGSVFGLGNFYTEFMKGLGASERVFELLYLTSRITKRGGRKVDHLNGDIEYKDVSFSYPSRDQAIVLPKMSLTIKQGENVCFVGPSGSGKSTVASLLLRIYDPKEGKIEVDGMDISSLNVNSYRSLMGYVQQEPLLFSGTIRENLVFGKVDATDEEIEESLEWTSSSTFVAGLNSGLDTVIGPSHSTQLSGGQKQRLSIARTLIKKPQILVLDEATSALDSISEEQVMRKIKELSRSHNVTVISIAHRLSTIKNSDRIIVLNKLGEIVEDGPFEELYADESSQLNQLLQNKFE